MKDQKGIKNKFNKDKDKILSIERTGYGAKIRPNIKGIRKTSRRKFLNNFDKKELEKARKSFRKLLNQNFMKHTMLKRLALEHAKYSSTDPKMNGPYSLYLRVAFKKYGDDLSNIEHPFTKEIQRFVADAQKVNDIAKKSQKPNVVTVVQSVSQLK